MVNQCTKFDVSSFTRYEAMNGGAKCRKWGGLGAVRGHSGSAAMSPFDRAHMTSYSTLIQTTRLSAILYRVRDIACYLSKVADFDPPHLHLAPPQVVTLVEFRGESPWAIIKALGDYDGHGIYPLYLIDLLAKLSSLRSKQREHYQNGLVLRKESDKVVSILHICSTSQQRW